MGKYLGSTGLTYLWGKIKSIFVTKTELAGHPTGRIYYGTCSTTANTYTKVATVDTFPLDEDDKPLVGTVVAIKYTVTNTYKTEGQTYALNVNNTGAYPIYYNNAEVATSTSANTLAAGYKNRHVFYVFNGTQWVWLSASYDTNTTYSGMTQAEVDAGTGTTARLITPARLRDNFYTEGEVDTLLGSKANSNDLATVATSGSYNDLDDTPTIPSAVTESTVSGWGFTKNTGTYSKPSGGIPASDLADAVQTSLGKADTALQSFTESDPTVPSHVKGITTTDISNWNGKQAAIADLSDIRSGAALGATALQSYTETDPTVPAWAKQSTKPSYTAAEVGALPDTTTIPAAPGTLNTTATTAQSTSSSEALSGNITLHKVAKTGTYNDLIGKPTIPTVPTNVSAFTNDAGYTTNTGTITGITMNGASKGTSGVVDLGTVLTAHQDISGKQDTISNVIVAVDANTGTPSGTVNFSNNTLAFSFSNLKGATGATGPQGIQGVQGPQGPKGDTGVTGDASSLAIIHGIDKTSSYATTDVCGADAAQALLNEIEGGFYY